MTLAVGARPATPRRFPYITVALSLLCCAGLVSLGVWQLHRLHWKLGLIAAINHRIHSAPRPFAALEKQFAETGDVEYWPVTVSGTFDYKGERDFFATWKGASGFFVYTPMKLADGRYLFVNRGFVPYDLKDPATRPKGEVRGEVTVTGLARDALKEKPSFIVPANNPAENIFFWKDLSAMAATAGLPAGAKVAPFFVDANAAPNPGGLPVGGVTRIDLPNNHFGYALTWFGLAAGLLGVLAGRLWRWWREERTVPPPA